MENNQYYKVENDFFKIIERLENDNLLFYCVTGSLARNDLIEGWSDIDLLMVFKEYSSDLFSHINEALSGNKSMIKIGTTFYSRKEFNSKELFKDPKTRHAIEYINKAIYIPRINNQTIVLPELDKKMTMTYDLVDMAKYLHNIRRELIDQTKFNERSVYKLIISVIKMLLYRQNIQALGYKDALAMAKDNLTYFNIELPLPMEILEFPKDKNKRYNNYIKFLNWLKEYRIA